MLTVAAILLAVFVLDAPWSWVAVIAGASLDVAETAVCAWWSKRRRASVGVEALVGRRGVAVSERQVRVAGELWSARGAFAAGDEVVVRAVEGLVLEVERP